MNKLFVIILIAVFLVFAITFKFYLETSQVKPIKPSPITLPKEQIKKIEYAVIIKEGSKFGVEARRFAQHKNAEVITYFSDFNETLIQLKEKQPKFLAIFATPEELTPDFITNLDENLKYIDEDPYYDVAYGIITSRNENELHEYVSKLINYKPSADIRFYGIGGGNVELGYNFGINTRIDCLFNCGASLCICTPDHQANLEKIKKGLIEANVVSISAHGNPSTILLDNGDELKGDPEGLLWTSGTMREKEFIRTNATLVMIFSCLTGRINGKPSFISSIFKDEPTTLFIGNPNTSIVLSFLEAGTLSYIGVTNVAAAGRLTEFEHTILQEAIIDNKPIGIAVKDAKNKPIFNAQYLKKDKIGSPANPDPFVQEFLIEHARMLILFGDPSLVIATKTYNFTPNWPSEYLMGFSLIPCFFNYKETINETTDYIEKKVEVKINGENQDFVHSVERKEKGFFSTGGRGCTFKTSLNNGKLEKIEFKSIKGIKKVYEGYDPTLYLFYDNLGDEVMITVPFYIADFVQNGNSRLASLKPENVGNPNVLDQADITLEYEILIKK
jgi:hypothetical protein